ncbi:MAG: hypothetical protein LBU55_03670, partial [Elusimicrobiota bacterium]|nr:hypothetical protein [Elusimicrobiota bacterium]
MKTLLSRVFVLLVLTILVLTIFVSVKQVNAEMCDSYDELLIWFSSASASGLLGNHIYFDHEIDYDAQGMNKKMDVANGFLERISCVDINGSKNIFAFKIKHSSSTNNGGVAFLRSGGYLEFSTITTVSFHGNSSALNGGAFFVGVSTLMFTNVSDKIIFSSNIAGNDGGAMILSSSVTLNFRNTNTASLFFTGNTAKTGAGGALAIVADGDGSMYTSVPGVIKATFSVNTTFENNISSKSGGALYIVASTSNAKADVSFLGDTTIFSGNTAFNNNASIGGAMYSDGKSAVVYFNSDITEFKNNLAYNAGALSLSQSAVKFDNTVNFSSNSAYYRGGAVIIGGYDNIRYGQTYNFANVVNFIGNSIINAEVVDDGVGGGALTIIKATAAFSNQAVFKDNKAIAKIANGNSVNGKGGAILIENSTLDFLSGVNFIGNSAGGNGGGGGGALAIVAPDTTIKNTVNFAGSKTTFENNSVTDLGIGGAIFIEQESTSIFFRSQTTEFKGNSTNISSASVWGQGGAIAVGLWGSTTSVNLYFESNVTSFTANTSHKMGALSLSQNTVNFNGAVYFTSNVATKTAGAVGIGNVAFNDVDEYTNPVSRKNQVYNFDNVAHFIGNTATAADGGALAVYTGTANFKTNSVVLFEKNVAAKGGALSTANSGIVNFNSNVEVVFRNNTASTDVGGAIFNWDSVANFTKAVLFSNNVSSQSGGAFFSGGNSYSQINFNTDQLNFTSNTSQYGSGGSLYFYNTSVKFEKGTVSFHSNTADSGGAIYSASGSSIESSQSSNLTFANNVARSGSGGALHVSNEAHFDGTLSFNNNTAAASGGAAYLDVVNNTITSQNGVWNFTENVSNGTSAGSGGGGLYSNSTVTFQGGS